MGVPKRTFLYIARHYLKNFLILLIGLSLAVVFIDFLQQAQRLHGGANRKILYAFYTWEYMVALIYPLVILMAMAWTQISFIYRNVFVSLFSFGFGRRQILIPFLASGVLIYLVFTGLQMTSFAYGQDRARMILHADRYKDALNNLFFKYNDSFVYASRLDPLHKALLRGMIFEVKKNQVVRTLRFDEARFHDGEWIAPRALVRSKRFDTEGELTGFEDKELKNMILLKGYRPKVFRKIYEGGTFSLVDSLAALHLLKKQGLSADKVKAILYNKVLTPLFALAMMVIFFYRTPLYHRFVRKEQLWTALLGSALLTWALLFALFRLGMNGVIDPDLGQTLPILILILYAWRLDRRIRRQEAPLARLRGNGAQLG
ncbi:LptF/LptG family permease [Nitratifractor salsuginis]|uniref:Permease YjgP/YjgQ family protein n=1 Tax=Nitratifractor salsuginis (strain DSM 16511 / JCM 12458 / E9I37-1) TaxID=749222 RepID=E6WZI3_NITSE|nr:LptF/LptG family permease [Nitratifractor salsuginis]ADV45563.1 permease YjgP/YjgQ family protein [Nitratifractor salsuginis DSM 16511]